jgi:hypothetical protein
MLNDYLLDPPRPRLPVAVVLAAGGLSVAAFTLGWLIGWHLVAPVLVGAR